MVRQSRPIGSQEEGRESSYGTRLRILYICIRSWTIVGLLDTMD